MRVGGVEGAWLVAVAIWSLEQDTEINSPSMFKKENWLILSCKPHGIILSIGVSLSLLGSNQGGGGCTGGNKVVALTDDQV